MLRLNQLKLPLDATPADLRQAVAQTLGLSTAVLGPVNVFRRSFDARQAQLQQVFSVDFGLSEPAQEARLLADPARQRQLQPSPDMAYRPPTLAASGRSAMRPVVVGFGPCGIFAALTLARLGLHPLVLERGRRVRERTQDTWGLWRKHRLDPESNVQFGEGGAGTFSDGKLYSQVKDPRFLGRKVMHELVQAGAPEDILTEAHPHIGTFRLVKVVERLRAEILALGGDILFEQRLTELHLEDGRLQAISVLDQASGVTRELALQQLVLALGHSARDTFVMLHQRGVMLQAKPFSVGLRIEHPQRLIDRARWGRHAGNPLLGAAAYKLVHHASNGRSAYSFCMCPGGTVVAATSESGRVVTNGMSQHSRNQRNANAALVVGITPADFAQDAAAWQAAFAGAVPTPAAATGSDLVHPLAGVVLQRQLEARAFALGGGDYCAPAQRVADFLAGRPSTGFGSVLPSYRPGVRPADLSSALPDYAIAALRQALPAFGRQLQGFDMDDAVLTGVETRTSSPLRIPRGADFQSLNVRGLYPAGEGAGYAGGILSAAIDGIEVAEALAGAASA